MIATLSSWHQCVGSPSLGNQPPIFAPSVSPWFSWEDIDRTILPPSFPYAGASFLDSFKLPVYGAGRDVSDVLTTTSGENRK